MGGPFKLPALALDGSDTRGGRVLFTSASHFPSYLFLHDQRLVSPGSAFILSYDSCNYPSVAGYNMCLARGSGERQGSTGWVEGVKKVPVSAQGRRT
jgi:hypothetical protein